MADRTILISGAGVAGPTLAYWLLRQRFQPTIVERAPAPRRGGYIIDFWGVGYAVAERMGLIERLRDQAYQNDLLLIVDENGKERSRFGGTAIRRVLGDKFFSLQRSDLARVLLESVQSDCEIVYGDELVAIDQRPSGVDVMLQSGKFRSFDLVIGADGLHSKTRALSSIRTRSPERYLGYYVAAFTTNGYPLRSDGTYVMFAAPGRQIGRFSLRGDRTGFLFVFAKKDRNRSYGASADRQKQILRDIYADISWIEWPDIQQHLETCDDLYFDAVSQIELPTWSNGRVAYVGDAAHCPSLLAGEGASFAMAGAYMLAGELARAELGYQTAFKRYEKHFRPFIERKQKSAREFASSFAPKTNLGLITRDIVFKLTSLPFVAKLLLRQFVTDRFSLPDYHLPHHTLGNMVTDKSQ